ncbi:methyl-accepting chemotaxis protein [Fulvimarina sp. MAC8]|uniref:methyl-accepting chemotaxis protein n=1 Tax=Fulvimarina sp. MAC8 TaxID=3162874 RepID=UPI0032EDA39D
MRVRSLSAKLMLVAGGSVALILVGSIALSGWHASESTRELVFEQAQAQADSVANSISTQVALAASAAKATSGAIGAANAVGMRERETVMAMLRANVENYDVVFGSWMAERPNAFDGARPEEGAAPLPGANEDGVFAPYWTRAADGGIEFSTFAADYEAAWYKLASESGKGAITEPYMASEVKKLMTSIAFPVFVKGREIGVAGVDISLDTLSKRLEAMQPFGDGRVLLVSGAGNWLVPPEPDLMMKPYEGAGAKELTSAIADGTPRVLNGVQGTGGTSVERIIFPFAVPEGGAVWATVIDIPTETIAAPIRTEVLSMVGGGLLILLVALGAIYAASVLFVRRPLGQLLGSVSRLGEKDYTTPVADQARNDEVGAVAKALEGFRHALASGEAAEGAALASRIETEREREARAGAERAKAEELEQFVAQIRSAFDKLALGDLTVRMTGRIAPEYEAIRDQFNHSIERLEGAVGAVVTSISSIRGGLDEINMASNDLAKRSEQQAAGLEETTAALTAVAQAIHETAESAERARFSAETACGNAEKGSQVVGKAIQAMAAIERSSEEIGKIIVVIDEIAFQTNLLALNAGVEAARAGESGRGFAVVAQEVRALSQRSASAAQEIKALISQSGDEVGRGVELVTASGKSLEEIVGQVSAMTKEVASIARTAHDQSVSLREVSTAADQMDRMTQQNAAMVEETTAATQTLSSETNTLGRLVDQFRTGSSRNKIIEESRPVRRRAA